MEAKQVPPAAVRNTPPLLGILTRVFSPAALPAGTVLEIAAGSGYHAAAFAAALPHLTWQPTDGDAGALTSIGAYVAEAGLANLKPPLVLDVCERVWPVAACAAMVCINMIHISPWDATLALFQGGARVLSPGAPVVTYGPYSIHGDFGAESNMAFDQSLRARNPAWGVRDVKDVANAAERAGFAHVETVTMPANNLTLVFRKAG